MKETTLCYIFSGSDVLLLHRTKKQRDENAQKYIGLGGHIEKGETPEECILREIREESGLTPSDCTARGIVLFRSDVWEDEKMYLFTARADIKELPECDEGELCLAAITRLNEYNMWEGDRIFLSLLLKDAPFFTLELIYRGEKLEKAVLNGQTIYR